MKMALYSLFDKLNGYASPIPFGNDDIARRWFKEMVAENTTVKHSPDDFNVYKLGEIDTETGEITPRKELVC